MRVQTRAQQNDPVNSAHQLVAPTNTHRGRMSVDEKHTVFAASYGSGGAPAGGVKPMASMPHPMPAMPAISWAPNVVETGDGKVQPCPPGGAVVTENRTIECELRILECLRKRGAVQRAPPAKLDLGDLTPSATIAALQAKLAAHIKTHGTLAFSPRDMEAFTKDGFRLQEAIDDLQQRSVLTMGFTISYEHYIATSSPN
jgi:hypothetical protein